MYAKIPKTEVKSESGESVLFHDTKGIPRTLPEMQWAKESKYVIPAFRNGSIDVEKLLDYVDVKLDWYTPSEEAFNVINFIRLSMGREPENLNSKAHYFFIDAMLGSDTIKPYYDVRGMDFKAMVGNSLILSTREFSKALAHDTLIATPKGDIAIEDIEDGDYVYSRTGKPTRVKKKSPMFFDNTFEMKLSDGRSFKSSNDHEHILWRRTSKHLGYFDEDGNRVKKGKGKSFRLSGMEEVVMTSQDLEIEGVRASCKITNKNIRGDECKYFIPMIDNPIEYPEVDYPIDPYTVGVYVSDGSNLRRDNDIDLNNCNEIMSDYIVDKQRIPNVLMKGSVYQRMELLKGLMDTDGTIDDKGNTSYTSVSKQLVEDVRDLVYSLGGSAYISERMIGSDSSVVYCVIIRINKSIFKLRRKKDKEVYVSSRNFVAIESFEMVHSVPSYCLAVECPTKSFVMSNGLLTHNSVLVTFFILYIAYTGKKTGFGRVNLLLYVSDRMEGNVKATMRTIKGLVKKSEFLSDAFEDTHFTDSAIRLIRHPRSPKEIKAFRKGMEEGKSLDQIMFRGQRTFTLQGVGSSGGRGPLSLDSILFTDNGKVTMKDIKVGDRVFTPKGNLSTITKKSKIFNNRMFKLTYKDGRTLKVNESHINVAWFRHDRFSNFKKEHITTLDLLDRFRKNNEQIATRFTSKVQYTKKSLIINPYLLGLYLGDGDCEYGKSMRIKGLRNDCESYADKLCNEYNINKSYTIEGNNLTEMLRLTILNTNKILISLDLSGITGENKFIPDEYLYGSIEQRKELLAGLLDTNGSCLLDKRYNTTTISFSNISKNLVDGVAELSRSLGYRARISFKDKGGNRKRLYTVNISSEDNPFILKRKHDAFVKPKRFIEFEKLVNIEEIKSEPSQCIAIDDEEHEFLTDGYLPTHNTRDEDLARPDGVVFDDLIANERDAFSKAILESIESTITSDVGSSLSGNKSFQIFIGTAYHTNDPIYKRAGNGTVLPVVFPRAEVAPHGDIYDSTGKLIKKAITEEEFISVWPDRHSFKKQRKAYKEAELALESGDAKLLKTRNQEYYVRVVSSSDRLIAEESIKFVNCVDVIMNAKDYSWFVTTDYTTSNNVGADLSGAALWARDYLGNTYLMMISLHLKAIEEQYDDTLDMTVKATNWGARWVDVGVEIDGQQAVHLYGLRKRADERGVPLYLARQIDPQGKGVTWEGIRSKEAGSKLWRLKLIEPEYSMGRMYFNETLKYNEDLDELLRELALTTHFEIKSKHDDGLDILSQLALMQQWHELPSKVISKSLDNTEYNDDIRLSEFNDIEESSSNTPMYNISY